MAEDRFEIENGFVKTKGEEKLFAGFPAVAKVGDDLAFALGDKPFLTPVTIPLDEEVTVVTDKFLVAPKAAVKKRRVQRVIPFSFRNALRVTVLTAPWAVLATRSRVRRLVLKEGEVATIAVQAAVAWSGKPPTGFLPRLRLRDLFIPNTKPRLCLNFYGPAVVWHEGA